MVGRIFISAGHGGFEGSQRDPGAIAGNTTEAREMMLVRDEIVNILQPRGYAVFSVPDTLSLRGTIDWINARSDSRDVALEIHADAFNDPTVRGATCFYIANNEVRRQHGQIILSAYLRRVPQIPSRGVKPDTATAVGRLAFCRDVRPPSLLLELGFLTNPQDRFIIQNQRRDIGLGVAEGLATWLQAVTGTTPP
ncbi:N-acetylmuramoyl-L-alanine amidase family protein, partial [Trichothermofontia sp.]